MDMRGFAMLLRPFRQALDNLIARAVVRSVAQGKVQILQVAPSASELKDRIEHLEPAGWTSHPLPGAEALVLFLGGDRSHGVATVVADRRTRPADVPAGAVCVYASADAVSKIWLKPEGEILIEATNVTIEASADITLRAEGKLRLEGDDVEIHAGTALSWDVDGFGRRITSAGGGAYEDHTWQEEAVVTPVSTAIAPPEGP